MRKLYLQIIIYLPFVVTAQDFSIELSGRENEKLRNICEYHFGEVDSATTIPFVYIEQRGNKTDYYLGLISSCDNLYLPSYYFFTKGGIPVFIYNGFERQIKFSDTYVKAIERLCHAFLYPEEIRYGVMIHHPYWHYSYVDEKLKSKKPLSHRKAAKKYPSWIILGKGFNSKA